MSSPKPSTRKHYPRTAPRNFTEEQVWFVLNLVRTHSNKDIMTAFNQHFEGVRTLELNQVKYIRTSYGRDPHWGAPMVVAPLMPDPSMPSQHMPDHSSQPGRPFVGNQEQALNGGNNIQLPALRPTSANTGYIPPPVQLANPFGANTSVNMHPNPKPNQQSAYPLSPLRPSGTRTRQDQQAGPSQSLPPLPELDFSELLAMGTWHEGTHDDCELDAQHRHDPDGGVFFPSKAAVMQMIARSRVFVRREDLGDMMEDIRAHTVAMNALQATMAANLASTQEGGQPPAALGSPAGSVAATKAIGHDNASGSSLPSLR